ncbi:MAG: hypothetical protein EXR62_10590 [Chloroflexi bacterium]|nr:hypothetical protein [Chloroflexota bacterium]
MPPNRNAKDVVKGLYDTHLHPGPDVYPRVADAIEIVQMARHAGMGGVVFKTYAFMNALLATLLERHYPGIDIIGAICLEAAVGGINPWAVEMAIEAGAKVIWLPALDSEWNLLWAERYGQSAASQLFAKRPRLSPVRDGKVSAEALEIFRMVGAADIVLQSGHLHEDHRELVAEAALQQGVRKFIITHANMRQNFISLEQHRRLVQYPNVYFEYCAAALLPWLDNQDPAEIAAMIRTVGPERAVLGSDAGYSQSQNGLIHPHPVEALAALVGALQKQGFSEVEIQLMGRHNPRRMFGLE